MPHRNTVIYSNCIKFKWNHTCCTHCFFNKFPKLI
ncbi:hypothetical protein ACT7C5_02995 [Bacillus pacificus]